MKLRIIDLKQESWVVVEAVGYVAVLQVNCLERDNRHDAKIVAGFSTKKEAYKFYEERMDQI